MQVKTSELAGAALDWAVAKCEGATDWKSDGFVWDCKLNGKLRVLAKGWSMSYCPCTDWKHGGTIIEREALNLEKAGDGWASRKRLSFDEHYGNDVSFGPTPLIAAMRCYVASKMGDIVEIPDGLK